MSGDDRRLAQTLVDQGIAAEAGGGAPAALQYYRKAVEADCSFAPAHMNLGIALHASGELTAAVASYERAIALDPTYAAAHYNLALTHLLSSQYSQAEASFRAALRFRQDFPEAWVGLADALEELGRDADALAALDRAIALRGDYVGALLNASAISQRVGRLDVAVANAMRVVELDPDNYIAQYRLGICLHGLGRLTEAETEYRRALALKPDDPAAKTNLAVLLQAKGRTREALKLLFEAAAKEPGNDQLREILVGALRGAELGEVAESERTVLLSLCLDDRVSTLFLISAIVTAIKGAEGFRILQKSALRGDDPLRSFDPAVEAFLRDPLLLAALPRMPMADAAVEEVLAYTRRCILMRFRVPSAVAMPDPEVPTEFVCALARQCFFSGYAFFADEKELRRVTGVRERVQHTLRESINNPQTLEPSLAVVSLYGALHTLKGCERLLEHPMAEWSAAFRPIVQEQIGNRIREREIATRLTSISTIDDQISLAVRAQYEENPYPRWVATASPDTRTIEELSTRLRPGKDVRVRPRPVPILVAGCGTGRHPILIAKAYPDSEILAVDLSLASLAYAVRMTEQLGISNIKYRQADILKLGTLEKRFAIVECAGVLHHLDDPMAGWRILVKLLEPDGLMRIALYSEKARGAVRAAREFTQSLNLPLTPEGIRDARNAIRTLPSGHPAKNIMNFADFYMLDECRDLMMHIQEHQFTLPQIADCLDQLDLEFLELECDAKTRDAFRAMFPKGVADTDLKAWDEFESTYPDTFGAMYLFWCCRR